MNIAFNATGGKLTSAFLIRWMLTGLYPWEGGADTITGQVVVTGIVAAVMLVLVAPKWLKPENAATWILPAYPEIPTAANRPTQRSSGRTKVRR